MVPCRSLNKSMISQKDHSFFLSVWVRAELHDRIARLSVLRRQRGAAFLTLLQLKCGQGCRRGPSLLVAEGRLNTKGRAVTSRSKTGRGVATVPVFLLVLHVKLGKRPNLAQAALQAVDSVPGTTIAGWSSAVEY